MHTSTHQHPPTSTHTTQKHATNNQYFEHTSHHMHNDPSNEGYMRMLIPPSNEGYMTTLTADSLQGIRGERAHTPLKRRVYACAHRGFLARNPRSTHSYPLCLRGICVCSPRIPCKESAVRVLMDPSFEGGMSMCI